MITIIAAFCLAFAATVVWSALIVASRADDQMKKFGERRNN